MLERKLDARDFIWEIVRRNKLFRDEFGKLSIGDNGEKEPDPGFCYNWAINKLYHPSITIENIKSRVECEDNYSINHPIIFSMIQKRSEAWYKKYLFDIESKKAIRLCNPFDSFYNLDQEGWPYLEYEINLDEAIEDEGWLSDEPDDLVGCQLSLLDLEGVRSETNLVENNSRNLLEEEILYDEKKALIVNIKSVKKYFEYLKQYDEVEKILKSNSDIKYRDGAICLSSTFNFCQLYEKKTFEKEKNKRIKEFDYSIFDDENKLSEIMMKYLLDTNKRKTGWKDILIDTVASDRTTEALEKRQMRAFQKATDFIVNAPHNIIFTKAKFKPTCRPTETP